MAKLEIFIGYMGLIPQYHIVDTFHESQIDEILKEKSKKHFVKSVSKPNKFFTKVSNNFKKNNKRSTNYEGLGLNKKM